ncbi:unnamed protein product [Ascophyllum nodosum]
MPHNIPPKPGSVIFTKVRVENLPLSGQENDFPLVRVNFGVAKGYGTGETPHRLLEADGSVEWTDPIEFEVEDTNTLIFAVISWKSTKQGDSWTEFDDGRFNGPVVYTLPGVWECTPNGPTGPSLYAEVKVHEGSSARPAPMIRSLAQRGSGPSGGFGSSGSYDSFSQVTSGSSSVYEDALDVQPAMVAGSPGGRTPMRLPRARSEGLVDAPLPARREEIPTAEAVPEAVPIAPSASGSVSSSGPHRRHRRAERSSWTASSSQAPPTPLIRRARSGGSLVREISARSWRRQSSSHSQELTIPEESPHQPVDITTLRSPVGTHRPSSLLKEDVPLQETKESPNNASISSTFTPMSRAREQLLVHSGPPCVPIQRQEGADAPASSTAITMSHARARLISEGSQQPWGIRPAFADPMHGRSGAGEDGRFAPAAGIEAEGLSKEMKTEERSSSFAAAGAAPSAAANPADAAAGRKKGWHLHFPRWPHKAKKEEEPRPPMEDAQADQSSPTATRTSRRPFSSATSATAEEVEEKETRVYRRVPARDGLASVVRQEDRGAKTAQVIQSLGRQRHEMTLQEARTRDEVEAEGAGVMVAARSEGVEQTTAVAAASVESPSHMERDGLRLHPRGREEEQARPKSAMPPVPVQLGVLDSDLEALSRTPGRLSVVSSTEDLTGFDDTAKYLSRPEPSAPSLLEMRPELGSQSSSSLSDGEYEDEDDEDEDVSQAKARSLLDPHELLSPGTGASPAPYASGSMLQDTWYSSRLIADDAQGRELPPNSSIKQSERNPPRAVEPSPRSIPAAEKVIFDCFSPRAVAGGKTFELTIMAYLRQQRNDALEEMNKRAVVEAGIPTAIPIMLNKRVTVMLDLPKSTFTVLSPRLDHKGRKQVTQPDVREFSWTGEMAEANFTVGCKPEADTGWIKCGANIIEGGKVTQLHFGIEVVHAGVAETPRESLPLKLKKVRPNVAVILTEELEVVREIGRGVQGETLLCKWNGRGGGKRVAVKRLATDFTLSPSAWSWNDLKREAATLSLLGYHPNIVDFYGICQQGDHGGGRIQVVTKYEEGGSIHDALCLGGNGNGHGHGRPGSNGNGHRNHGSIHELDAGVRIRWARQVASGLVNVHAANVVHNDVACRNALLSCHGGEADAKLCDFGLSRLRRWEGAEIASLVEFEGMDYDRCLPLKQMPKEALEYPYAFSTWSDSWMFGTFLYEMFEGRPPFADLDPKQIVKLVCEGKRLEPPVMLTNQGRDLEKLFVNCLESNYLQRPSMEDIVVRLDGCLPLM